MEVKALIIDDEPLAREVIKEYSRKLPSLTIAGECGDAICAHEFLQANAVDLLFLDINMPKLSGIDFLRNYRFPPLVILTTAYSDYAMEGYELNVIDYLKKPFSFERFFKAYSKAEEMLLLKQIAHKTLEKESTSDFIFIKSDKKTIKVNIADICYIEGLGDYIKIYLSNKKLISNLSMKKIAELLPANKFYRIHKSFIVSLENMDSIEGNMIHIKEARLPIGNNFRADFMQYIRNFLAE